MKDLRFNKYWMISGIIAFVILFTFLVVDIYNRTLEDEKLNHQMQQLQMVKATAQGIDFFIQYLVNDIRFLSSAKEVQKGAASATPYLELFLGHQNSNIISGIYITNTAGKVQYYAGRALTSASAREIEYIIDASRASTAGYIITNVTCDSSNTAEPVYYFHLLHPIISHKADSPEDTAGYIGYIVNFKLLLSQFIEPLKLTKDDFAWVIDGEGRLIYHPLHEEMLLLSIKKTETKCFDCHISFDIQNQIILATETSMGEYHVMGDEPPKIMAYAPLVMQNAKWVIVISTFVPKVTENLRDKFRGFFILGFVILGVLFALGGLIYIINAKRIRAEEAKRALEQIQEYREQLNHSSRLASIGELVDYVAHEINTPAGIISAHVDALILNKNKGGDLDTTLALIKKQVKRISEYTSTLLNYSKRIQYKPEPVDIVDLMNECANVLSYRYKVKHIKIIRIYEDTIPKIMADPKQLEQVFINLINNAVDAVYSGGAITLLIGKKEKDEKEFIEINVKDNGRGIADDIIGKVFTPFFTTKKNNQGTGLGLAIVRAIILRHRGEIFINSEEGKGTIVTILLPLYINKD